MFSRKLLIIYIILLLLVLAIMGSLIFRMQSVVQPRDYYEIKQSGVLRIVTEYNQSGYFMSGDTLQGFQYELCRKLAEYSGLEVEIHLEMSLDKSFEGLKNNRYDVIARNIPTTTELKEHYLFVEPMVLNKQVLVQRKTENNNGIKPLRNQLELAKKTLYVPENSPAILRLQNLQYEIADTIHIVEEPLYSSEQLIIMVAKGDIDYAVCDHQIARLSKKQYPEIDIDTDISFTQLQSWAVRKHSPDLLDSLNHWFAQMRKDGTFDKIYRKYYHIIPPTTTKMRIPISTTDTGKAKESAETSTPVEETTHDAVKPVPEEENGTPSTLPEASPTEEKQPNKQLFVSYIITD